MIFVCVGSRDYQFDRLLKALDQLAGSGQIRDEIVAQIGQSQYEPKYYQWYRYLDREQFKEYQKKANLIISHGGTGALIGALKLGKQVIAVPRFAKYGEHIDDHQTQITGVLAQEGYLREVREMDQLEQVIGLAYSAPIQKRYDTPSNIPKIICEFLDQF